LSLYIVLIDVLIYSAAQLQECLINLLSYLLTSQCIHTTSCCILIYYQATAFEFCAGRHANTEAKQ